MKSRYGAVALLNLNFMASRREERQQDTHFKVMYLIQEYPKITTREIANRVGVSNGAAHYCVTALVEKGFVKLQNFSKSKTKANYLYKLTPSGIRAKASLAIQFLERKRKEYHELKDEIERFENDLSLERQETPGDLKEML